MVDFVDFAYRLPITVIGTFLGIPRSDLGWFRDRTQRIDDYLDLGGKAPEKLSAANQAAEELNDYYARMIAERRIRPRDDLVGSLVHALDSGTSGIDEQELIDNLLVLVNASFVTTMNLLTNGLELLLADPAADRRVARRSRAGVGLCRGDPAASELGPADQPEGIDRSRAGRRDDHRGQSRPHPAGCGEPRSGQACGGRHVRSGPRGPAAPVLRRRPVLLCRRCAGPDGRPGRVRAAVPPVPGPAACGGAGAQP